MTFPIIKRRFTPAQFADYVEGLKLTDFKPSFCVLHNTAVPSLAQRPIGFTADQMESLRTYYSGLGWRGSPHCFVDDTEAGIWVLNPLDKRGTHSPSWNGTSWGIEMLGNYETESFTTGRGAKVRDNAVAAIALLNRKIGVSASTMRIHREDPATDHACPGKKVVKADFVARVAVYMGTIAEKGKPAAPVNNPKAWSVEHDGEIIIPSLQETANVRAMMEAVGGSLTVDNTRKVITIYGPRN